MKGRTRRAYLKVLREIEKSGAKEVIRLGRIDKQKKIKEYIELLKNSRSFIVIDLENLETDIYKEFKGKLEGKGYVVKAIKNRLFIKAMSETGLRGGEALSKYLTKPVAVVFSSRSNVFELANELFSLYTYTKLKPGEKAPFDIVVPSGPTDIPPGPMMSVFGRLRIPAQPREGRIYVIRDTVVAKEGQEISPELASLLAKLDILPKIVRPKIIVGYEEGLLIEERDLKIEPLKYQEALKEAVKNALNLATEVVVPDTNILRIVFSKAHTRAINLATELGVISSETISILLTKALINATALAQRLGLVQVSQQETRPETLAKAEEKKAEEKKEEREEEKEVSEEAIAEGLSALFG